MGNWLITHDNFWYSQVMVFLDNWAKNKIKISQTWLKQIGYNIIFIHTYSPDFAPVEMWFILIKRKLAEIG